MVKTSSLTETEHTMVIEGEGFSKKEAVANIFNKLRKKVYKDFGDIIVQMEPKDFKVIECNVTEYTEKFLFVFMPRKKEKVKMKAEVTIDVKYVEV